ncbi:MAG: hypothetical protein K8S54_06585 [Spirochaetia bacterium]|nr:hypothetical protein [Spirochaetia bacterium]
MKRLALPLIVLLGVSSCDSVDHKKDRDAEQQRLIYVASLLTRDSTDHCAQAETAALACSGAAGLSATYVSTLQAGYGITNATQTATAICSQLPSSVLFTGSTENARNCHFDCNKAYFERLQNEGRCTAALFPAALTAYTGCLPLIWVNSCSSKDSALNSCLVSCFKTGTVVP